MSKTAFITGASRGIGRAIAQTFAGAGYNLALCCHHSKEKLLSLLMDEVYETMEESESYGFGNMFRDTLKFIDEENRRGELYANSEE